MLSAKSIRAMTSPRFLFLAALAVRLVVGTALLLSGVEVFRDNEPSHIAAHLAKGEGFSAPYDGVPVAATAQQAPVYPLLVAVIFKLLGTYSRAALAAMVAINALAGAGSAALIYLLGQRYFSPTAAIIASWVWVCWVEIAATDVLISNYALSTCAVLAWLLLLPKVSDRSISWLLLGAMAGTGVLLNPTLMLVVVASCGWLLRRRVRLLATAGLACLVIVAPWVLRNYMVFHAFYPALRDNLGMELYLGNHPGMENNPRPCESKLCEGTANFNNADDPGEDPRLFASLGETEFMRQKKRIAISYIRSEPGKFFLRSAKRAASFWLLPHPVLRFVIVALAFVWVWGSSGPMRWFLLIMFGAYPIVFYMTQIAWVDNYRHPIEPLILLSAAAGGDSIYKRLRGLRGRGDGLTEPNPAATSNQPQVSRGKTDLRGFVGV
jgi:hypothetical protein